MIIRLIIGFLVSGLIAAGYYFYIMDRSGGNSASPYQNTAEIVEGAGQAVEQSQDLQNKINSKAQDAIYR